MELFSLLTQMKASGFEVGNIITAASIYLLLKRDLKKFAKNLYEEHRKSMEPQVDKIVASIDGHGQKFIVLEQDSSSMKQDIKSIKDDIHELKEKLAEKPV